MLKHFTKKKITVQLQQDTRIYKEFRYKTPYRFYGISLWTNAFNQSIYYQYLIVRVNRTVTFDVLLFFYRGKTSPLLRFPKL